MIRRAGLLSCIALMLGGCVSERVILLPSAEGKSGALLVRDVKGELLLDKPYAAIQRQGDANNAYQSSPEEVRERFGAVLAALPPRQISHVLYFEPGGSALTEASRVTFEQFRKEIAGRPAPEVRVVGHTDSVGSVQANDALSHKRAVDIREQLIAAGVPAEAIEAVGRGERDMLVPTADEVDEPRNRRVEINLR